MGYVYGTSKRKESSSRDRTETAVMFVVDKWFDVDMARYAISSDSSERITLKRCSCMSVQAMDGIGTQVGRRVSLVVLSRMSSACTAGR